MVARVLKTILLLLLIIVLTFVSSGKLHEVVFATENLNLNELLFDQFGIDVPP